MERRLKSRIDRLQWLLGKTSFVTVDGVCDNGQVARYLVHWNWPLSGQKCRINANSGEIIEFSKQNTRGIKIHQTTHRHSLENEFYETLASRLQALKEHIENKDSGQHLS